MDSRLSTKDKILELLKKEKSMTVSQLSKRLGITEMAVRKHLNMLERDSLLTVSEVKQPMGRPLQVFALSSKADELFPKNYENMTVEFLHDLKELHGEDIIDYLLEKRSERQKNSYLPNMHGKTAAEKVEKLTEIQNGKGYMADVTKIDDDTYEIVEHNCPIFAVAKKFKKACACETEMFKKVLGADQVERMTCRADNGDHCRFFVKFNKKKSLNV
ncbi:MULTISPECIES: helix-turn-helix transcriptional regulator [Bacillus]|uniref:helix-turn-helix transcriptional regulator n=1 Tax=Bacillus TaxID=1386 RepID=UPI001583A752|nr:metalloregulator ArsR/SmtB family transcription factor [Bacillus glycinifermentans]MBU8785127.1 winged helix-turn-helix transcriptional regulator [Bacillus glycinifermentans]NUJ15297.1 transcriptional regulator [Bacillus glycinifermentans]